VIDLIIQRLQQTCPSLKSVEGALDLASIMDRQFAVPAEKRPAAFVMLAGEQAGDNQVDIGGAAQIVTSTVQIAICVGAGETVGKTVARDAIATMRDAVLASLLGWPPVAGDGVLTYGGLSLIGFRPRIVWFQMIFARQSGVGT
jgi:hypothetical protein